MKFTQYQQLNQTTMRMLHRRPQSVSSLINKWQQCSFFATTTATVSLHNFNTYLSAGIDHSEVNMMDWWSEITSKITWLLL